MWVYAYHMWADMVAVCGKFASSRVNSVPMAFRTHVRGRYLEHDDEDIEGADMRLLLCGYSEKRASPGPIGSRQGQVARYHRPWLVCWNNVGRH